MQNLKMDFYVVIIIGVYNFVSNEALNFTEAKMKMDQISSLFKPPTIFSENEMIELLQNSKYKEYLLKEDIYLLEGCYKSICDGFYEIGIIENYLFEKNLNKDFFGS